jgi:hypothetical protein
VSVKDNLRAEVTGAKEGEGGKWMESSMTVRERVSEEDGPDGERARHPQVRQLSQISTLSWPSLLIPLLLVSVSLSLSICISISVSIFVSISSLPLPGHVIRLYVSI